MRTLASFRFPTAWGFLLLAANLLPAAEFLPLGFGDNTTYSPSEVSEDGSVVVGDAGPVLRWTRETGAEVLFDDDDPHADARP